MVSLSDDEFIGTLGSECIDTETHVTGVTKCTTSQAQPCRISQCIMHLLALTCHENILWEHYICSRHQIECTTPCRAQHISLPNGPWQVKAMSGKYTSEMFSYKLFLICFGKKSSQTSKIFSKLSTASISDCFSKLSTASIRIPPAASWLPILLSHIGSQVKRRQSQSYKFKEFAKITNFEILK